MGLQPYLKNNPVVDPRDSSKIVFLWILQIF